MMKIEASKSLSQRATADTKTRTARHAHTGPPDKPWGDVVGVPPTNGEKRQSADAGRRKSNQHKRQTLKVVWSSPREMSQSK
jgi:hypothetical protein